MLTTLAGAFCAIAIALVPATSTADSTGASETVRSLFSALGHHDYTSALSKTSGEAESQLASILDSVAGQAEKAHAQVELVVRDLELRELGKDGSGRVAVEARYDIAIFGKRSIFKVLAKHLVGTTQFVVADQRIVAFDPRFAN